MPASSENQRKAACVALAAKKGQMSPRSLQGPARQMFESMSMADLEDFCKQKVVSDA